MVIAVLIHYLYWFEKGSLYELVKQAVLAFTCDHEVWMHP